MATLFLEPGGDANFQATSGDNTFWALIGGAPVIATDFVHGNHIKSIKYVGGTYLVKTPLMSSSGARISVYIYLAALPTGTIPIIAAANGGSGGVEIKITSAGVLQLARFDTDAQIGSDGSILSTGVWYRISLALTISSTTVNRFEVFVDGVSDISVTNATIGGTDPVAFYIGGLLADATIDIRSSDHYVDDSSSLTDTGDIWVTAKRPVSNGTTNGFTTQIGSGGSGYGTGHSPQVNERPLSTVDGWSMVGAGSAVTEEYNIEGKSVGDIDISTATIIDYLGWVSSKTLSAETASIVVNGVSSNISLTTTIKIFTKIAGSSTYPAGTGTDIGFQTTTALTTVSLYECGVIVAYIPGAPATVNSNFLAFM